MLNEINLFLLKKTLRVITKKLMAFLSINLFFYFKRYCYTSKIVKCCVYSMIVNTKLDVVSIYEIAYVPENINKDNVLNYPKLLHFLLK